MIVTVEELRDYMSGIHLDGFGQYEAAEATIAGIQADLERYLHRYLEVREITETVAVNPDGRIRTSQEPTGLPVGYTGSAYLVGQWLYTYEVTHANILNIVNYLQEPRITVTYLTGVDARSVEAGGPGYSEYADVRLAVLRVSSREVINRHDDTLSVKGLSANNTGEPTGPQNGVQGWTMDELRTFDRLRKRIIL